MKTIVLLFQNNDDNVANNSNIEDIISINETKASITKVGNFELISNHSTENIMEEANTNDKNRKYIR